MACRVLFVFHYPAFGGPQNEVLRLAGPLERRGFETLVLLPREPGNAVERLRSAGIEVLVEPLGRVRATRSPAVQARFALGLGSDLVRLGRTVRRRAVELVVGNGLVNPQAALAARAAGVPMAWKLVDTSAPRPVRAAFVPLVRNLADATMYTGEAVVSFYGGRRRGGPPVVVYYPPVDTVRFAPSAERRTAARAELGVPPDVPLVGMVANIAPEKGVEYFVAAAALVLRSEPAARFLLVGHALPNHAEHASRIEGELVRTGLPRERLIRAGYRTDLESIYPALDVKLVTSRSEGMSTVALEAMACGVPVVATDVGALAEVVEEGVTGTVVPPADPRALAEATLLLLHDPERRADLARGARERAVERWGVEACAEAHVRAFEAARAGHDRRLNRP